MKRMFRWFYSLMGLVGFAAAASGASSGSAEAKEPITIKVGTYEYGVVYFFNDGKPVGFAPDLVAALNAVQSAYFFELVETSSRRRYNDLETGVFDMVLLESPDWEWRDEDVIFSDPIVTEHDLYIARRQDVSDAGWFDQITRREILCVLGFHYGFAKFNSSPDFLRDHFNISLLYSEEEVLDRLLAGDGETGVVSAGFLARKYNDNPELSEQVIIGPKPDSSYDLVSVMSRDSAIPAEEYNALIKLLHTTGNIAENWRKLHDDLSG